MGCHMRALVALTVALLFSLIRADDLEDAAPGCSRAFTRELRPVCASDGTIHHNPSIFAYHQCVERLQGREVTQMYMTHCDPAFDDTKDL